MSPRSRRFRTALTCAAVLAVGAPTLGAFPAQAAPQVPASVTAAAAAPAAVQVPSMSPAKRHWLYAVRKKIVKTALSRRNASYVWGGSGPRAFDCSGLVMWVYLRATGIQLPHYSGAQMEVTRPIARTRLRKGDLLFYGPNGSRHVAMYIGHGLQIGANNPRSGIVIDSINGSYWVSSYAGAGRVVTLKNF